MQGEKSMNMWKFIPPRERAKLLLMLIALIVITATMFGLVTLVDRRAREVPDAGSQVEAQPQPVAVEHPAIEELKEGEGPEVPEPPAPDDRSGEFDIYDPEILKDVKEDRTENAPFEAMVLLLHWLQGKTHQQLVEETRTDILVTQLLEKPEQYRGELVYADGVLEKIHKFRLATNSTGIDLLYFGKLKQTGEVSRTVCFYLIDGPLGAEIGDRVELRGYFLSLYKHKGNDEISPILVGRRFDPPDWLTDRASLDNVFDGDFNREHKAVYYCINKIMTMSQSQITAAVDNKITPTDLKTRPDEVRGKFVSFSGAVIQLRKQKLEPNPTGLGECFVGYLLTTDDEPCMFYILDRPTDVEENKLGRIDGIFMKNYRYVTRKNLEREAPVIIGRTLIPGTPPDASSLNYVILGVCGAGLIALAVAGITEARATRRRLKESREKTLSRMPDGLAAKAKEAARKAKEEQAK